MSGKRLLDVVALFKASRGVAQKHVALRARQLEVWSKTSSVAKAVKSQADRVTETAKATSFLASRLNEGTPIWAADASHAVDEKPIPSPESTEGGGKKSISKEGLEQDQFYEKSNRNNSTNPVPTEDLNIQQENAGQYPYQDGIAPIADPDTEQVQDVFPTKLAALPKAPLEECQDGHSLKAESSISIPVTTSLSDGAWKLQHQFEAQIPFEVAGAEGGYSNDNLVKGHGEDIFVPFGYISPVLSSLPRVKISKQTENVQGNDEHIQDTNINSDSYSSVSASEQLQAVPEQEQTPEGINTALFHSHRVAKMLGGRTQTAQKTKLKMSAAEEASTMQKPQASGLKQDVPPASKFMDSGSDGPLPTFHKNKDTTLAQKEAKTADPELRGTDIKPEVASPAPLYEMRESKVPSSRIERLWNYGGLVAGMFGGAISEGIRRATGSIGEGSYILSARNMDRLVAKLSRMRGAALKLGQMISFQDSKVLPDPIQQVLLRVQDSADYMPLSQRNKVLASNLGPAWRDMFSSFEEKPLAAASIGQVHAAALKSTGQRVAVKVQYPGVADSIDSDLSNLAVLLTASRLLPKGLFLDKTIANARTELAWECDYEREADCGKRFRELLSDEKDVFVVPKVFPEASGKQVLTMEYLNGVGVTKAQGFTQEQKDWIGTQILRLCLREITEFRFMQTDPNWTNFLYNAETNRLELLDFGASREYPEEFISCYTRLLLAASQSNNETVEALSLELGYLTGYESKAMLKAHTSSILTLAEPFLTSSPEIYDFRDQTITDRVKSLIPLMVRERLAPPPEETYSLHRKLSGAFLLCARLGSKVRCRELFENSMNKARLL